MQRNLWGISHMNVCVCSFSEKKDILSQWRAYGGSAGFSIGFKSSNLLDRASDQGFIMARCIYEEEHQRSLISRLIDETLAVDFNTQPGYVDPDRPNTFFFLATDGGFHRNLAKIAPIIKNKAFHEEQEWRLISTEGISVKNMSFRQGKSMVIPFFNYMLGNIKEEYLDRVIVGPTPHPELSKVSIESLLAHWSAADSVKTYLSEVPYRDW